MERRAPGRAGSSAVILFATAVLVASAGAAWASVDLSVSRGPGPGEVSLEWTGGPGPFSVYRSTDPAVVVAPTNLVGTTSATWWIDASPVGQVFYYSVESDCVASPPELCDGVDNDCDSGTPDGNDDPAVGTACDGSDSDLCIEGTTACIGGSLLCDDATGSTTDLCNGLDDDCDPASADGAEDPLAGSACDGADSDLCVEGTRVCSGGVMTCSDTSGSTPDLCNGVDDDCDAASADGAEDPLAGSACDGADGDLCLEGTRSCLAGSLSCSDSSGTTTELCNGAGADEDCDGQADEDFVRNDDPLCAAGTRYLGSIRGDAGSDLVSTTDYSEEWVRVRLTESSSSTVNLTARIELYSPSGTDFDLYVYCSACGPTPIASSTVGGMSGHTDVVNVGAQDAMFGGDDSFDAIIEVRHYNTTLCADWSLKIYGNIGGTASWCD